MLFNAAASVVRFPRVWGKKYTGFQAQVASDSPTTDSKINLKPGHLEYGNW